MQRLAPLQRDLTNSMIQLLLMQYYICVSFDNRPVHDRNEGRVKVIGSHNDYSSGCGRCTEQLTGSAWKNPWVKICSR